MLGSLVVPRRLEAGCEVRVLSGDSHGGDEGVQFVRGDLATGEGAERAVEGAGIVIHLAGAPRATRSRHSA